MFLFRDFLFSDFFVYLKEKSKNLVSVMAIIAEQPQARKK